MYSNLFNLLSNFVSLNSQDIQFVQTLFIPLSVKKDTVLITIGEVSDRVFFVNSGYLRYFRTVETGEEQTIHLSSPGEFAAAFCSFVTGTKSEEILHTVTDSDLLCITKTDLEKLYASEIKWQIFGRRLMESLLLEKEKRIISQISLPASDRYARLLETNPALIQNVPIQYLASFIGIQPESLSRIRKQIFLTNVK